MLDSSRLSERRSEVTDALRDAADALAMVVGGNRGFPLQRICGESIGWRRASMKTAAGAGREIFSLHYGWAPLDRHLHLSPVVHCDVDT